MSPFLFAQVPSVDGVMKPFEQGGVVTYAFGLLLVYFMWERANDRKNAHEERKARDAETQKFIAITERATDALRENTHTQELMQKTLETIAGDVRDLKRWRDGVNG